MKRAGSSFVQHMASEAVYINMWMLSTRISQPLSDQQYDTAFGVLCILFTIATLLTALAAMNVRVVELY